MRHKRLRISKSDANNLLDVLQEWEEVMGAKELSVSDVGLDWERYEELRARLKKFADSKIKDLPKDTEEEHDLTSCGDNPHAE